MTPPRHSDEWRELGSRSLLETDYLRVSLDRVATPTRPGGIEWTVAHRREAAVVAPRRADGRFILVLQERIPVRRELWEFPAGQVDGAVDEESIIATAHRELAEEAGCRVTGELRPMGYFWSSAGFTNERSHLFLATEVEALPQGGSPDEHEAIVASRDFSITELRTMIAAGEICDANTLSLFARLVVNGVA